MDALAALMASNSSLEIVESWSACRRKVLDPANRVFKGFKLMMRAFASHLTALDSIKGLG